VPAAASQLHRRCSALTGVLGLLPAPSGELILAEVKRITTCRATHPVPRHSSYCMDARISRQHHVPVRVLPHIKRLDDCFGDFLVRVVCECGVCREIQPQALARLVGWTMTLEELALRMRCSQCGKKAAEVVAVARPRPRGVPKNPHRR